MFSTTTGLNPADQIPPPSSARMPIVRIDDEPCVAIEDLDRLPPFFCSLTSDADLWLFASSTGALTAGRCDPDHALLPYETVDRIHDAVAHSGPVALLRWSTDGDWNLWEPLGAEPSSGRRRRLLKNLIGSRLIFEETRPEGLEFRSTLMLSEKFGVVRECALRNDSDQPRQVEVLHGLRNLLPSGVGRRLQAEMSCLVDAYKQNEILPPTGLGIFAMASGLTDQPVPCESLRATVAWARGLPNPIRTVDANAIVRFRRGLPVAASSSSRGVRANYLEFAALTVAPGEEVKWLTVADTGLDQPAVARLRHLLAEGLPIRDVMADISLAEARLRGRLAAADGLQQTGDPAAAAHHLANVLFNIMRGGVFPRGYSIDREDFVAFLATSNRRVAFVHQEWSRSLPETMDREALRQSVNERNCPHLARLFLEYLPLTFSRRHGDPSRPWNLFRIHTRDRRGRDILSFQGNWRDIFQNWEALALSFPGYLESMITKFVNASTVDGYNPYRISRDGIDWEEAEPENPWAAFGYWGDHQIVYLLKLLEAFEQHEPGALAALLARRRYTYANVPYRLRSFEEILRDPRHTLTCDVKISARLRARAAAEGSDAKLVDGPDGLPLQVTLMEKLLVPILAKWSNFVAGGGIWLNTQRPEWNDANNALVGNGLSVVTLCYLRRHQSFLKEVISGASHRLYEISAPVAEWLETTQRILAAPSQEDAARDPVARLELLRALGEAGACYRTKVYGEAFPTATVTVSAPTIIALLDLLNRWTDETLLLNRREDGLFHSYNLMLPRQNAADLRYLDPMLEGQVAVLSAGWLAPAEAADLLDALRRSPLYCQRRRSYVLYPDRPYTSFLEKNRVSAARGRGSRLLSLMVERNDDRLVLVDDGSLWRFHPDLQNAGHLRERLSHLSHEGVYGTLPLEEGALIEEIYEEVFNHHAFTGRSGSMFAYEGLGSIYWHMVSKLLLAAQENLAAARAGGAPDHVCRRLDCHYDAIRDGLGFRKTAEEYGAFPTDPYSHTPAHAGAQQPGMTGQVKEELLTRRGECGVWVRQGHLVFEPIHACFRRELTELHGTFETLDLAGGPLSLPLPAGSLAFTICQTPVVCSLTKEPASSIRVHFENGSVLEIRSNRLPRGESLSIFQREGRIRHLDVRLSNASH
jgi:hypothetical protein